MKKAVIIGGGESGIGAALLAKKEGYEVFVSDNGPVQEKYKIELQNQNIPFEEKGHTIEILENADVVIKSPGVPQDAAPCLAVRKKGKQIISEIEFGNSFYSGKIIAVTGSNGKTTTSGLIYHLLETAGVDVALGGNYGISFCRLLAEDVRPEIMVLELSSFQLEDIYTLQPAVAILLNITPDHLDRYGYDVKNYAMAKMRLIINQEGEDLFIYNGDDEITLSMLAGRSLPMKTIRVCKENYIDGIYSKELDSLFEINLIGKHNLFNAYCAIVATRFVGINDGKINLGLKTFRNVPHRMETIATINGIQYVNDSKATNVDAVYYALDGIKQKVIWIAGGTDKGNDYMPLLPLAKQKVKALICLGVDNEKLKMAFREVVPVIEETKIMVDAVAKATALASQGEVVLLSPACASFDLFKNYMDRGDQFREAVWQLIK